jgi:hypothetical protein
MGKTKNIFLISAVVFIFLLFIIPRSFISADLGNTILTVVAFLFGIIAGFYIVVTTTDYNNMKNILALETAGWISLYRNIAVYNKKMAGKLAKLLDQYIIRAFDFEIIDYARSTPDEFENINKLIEVLPVNDKTSTIYPKIRDNLDQIITARQQLAVLGTKSLSYFQWTVLYFLAIIFIISLYGLRTGELFFDIVTVIISSSIILVLLLIRDLDLYIWNEQTFSYDIFENVFKVIGSLPYYPIESITSGDVHPAHKKYRVGTYIDYPRSNLRKIKIFKAD